MPDSYHRAKFRLSFYTRDTGQLDRLFRASGLMRPKWTEHRGNRTYGERTIHTALGGSPATLASATGALGVESAAMTAIAPGPLAMTDLGNAERLVCLIVLVGPE